jgi:hypothetical protein
VRSARASRALAIALLTPCLIARHARAQEAAAGEEQPTPPPAASPWSADAVVRGVVAKPFERARSFADWGYGLSLHVGARWRDFPLTFGFGLDLIRWPESHGRIDVQFDDSKQVLDETRSDQTVMLGPWFRFTPPGWTLRPYVEGSVNLALLDTRYSFALENGTGQTGAVTDQAWAFGAGFGLGLEVLLARANDGSGAGLFASLGYRKEWGSNASFTRAPDASSANRTLSFDVPINTDLFLLGVTVQGPVRRR